MFAGCAYADDSGDPLCRLLDTTAHQQRPDGLLRPGLAPHGISQANAYGLPHSSFCKQFLKPMGVRFHVQELQGKFPAVY